jgi:hypothetical protein
MPEPAPARIRAYIPSDEKQVRFMIGQAQMEPLAYANNKSKDRVVFVCLPPFFPRASQFLTTPFIF